MALEKKKRKLGDLYGARLPAGQPVYRGIAFFSLCSCSCRIASSWQTCLLSDISAGCRLVQFSSPVELSRDSRLLFWVYLLGLHCVDVTCPYLYYGGPCPVL